MEPSPSARSPPPWSPSRVSREFLQRIPHEFARAHLVVSQGRENGTEKLLAAPGTGELIPGNVAVRLGHPVQAQVAEEELIARLIDEAYGAARSTGAVPDSLPQETQEEDLDTLLHQADQDLLSTQGKGQVVRLVDALLFEALGRRASDVHVQPLSDRTLVRYRVDGTLHTVRDLSKNLTTAVVSRIKVMGRMDIAERRIAQDGRTTVRIADRAIDLRISTFPTSYGERAVLRLLDTRHQLFELDALGIPDHVRERYLACATRSHGMILVTGPTGSGKTTTLYSTLRHVASPGVNVMTIEDPIEYELATVGLSVSQAQVNARKGVTFATGLRHILRQDPDVVLVGEIRDTETARMAIQSALTGHLVFSTLHTNDAPSAVTRLIDLGVEPFLVSASLSAVLAQRLVRTLHEDCSGKGCGPCYGTGFRGRTGLFELMEVGDVVRACLTRRAELAEIRAAAEQGGMRSLREEGEQLIRRGRTTSVEVERVVQGVS